MKNTSYNNKGSVPLKGNQIIRLRSVIIGFQTAFYQIQDYLGDNSNVSQETDFITTTAVSGCFTIELLLKYLYALQQYNKAKDTSCHPFGHDLAKLYSDLCKIDKKTYKELDNRFKDSKYNHKKSLLVFLRKISKGFEDWRYSYTKGKLDFSLNTMSDVINILFNVSESKYKILCEDFPKPNKKSNEMNEQFVSCEKLEDIKPNQYL